MKFYKLLFLIFILLLYSCSNTSANSNSIMTVHFIDVGQGDAILVQVNDKNLLIDSGPKESSSIFFNYLNSINIKKLDYILASHPTQSYRKYVFSYKKI